MHLCKLYLIIKVRKAFPIINKEKEESSMKKLGTCCLGIFSLCLLLPWDIAYGTGSAFNPIILIFNHISWYLNASILIIPIALIMTYIIKMKYNKSLSKTILVLIVLNIVVDLCMIIKVVYPDYLITMQYSNQASLLKYSIVYLISIGSLICLFFNQLITNKKS